MVRGIFVFISVGLLLNAAFSPAALAQSGMTQTTVTTQTVAPISEPVSAAAPVMAPALTSVGTTAMKSAAAAVDDPLTVEQVIVDKTAANAVVARDEAIVDARRTAFQMLAQRNLPPEDMATLKVPDNKTLATLVQDYEIKSEKLSSTRYLAKFTVRFREGVRNYINIQTATHEDAVAPFTTSGGETHIGMQPDGDIQGSKLILMLPYYEIPGGKTVLWEDPNPWRNVWQNDEPKLPEGGPAFIVPLGDISDVTAGPSDGAFSGNYTMLDTLAHNYNAGEVVLPVAHVSGMNVRVDVYTYKNGIFSKKTTVVPRTVPDTPLAKVFKIAAQEVLRYLQATMYAPVAQTQYAQGLDVVAGISGELTGQTMFDPATGRPMLAPATAPGDLTRTTVISGQGVTNAAPGTVVTTLDGAVVLPPASTTTTVTTTTSAMAAGATQVDAQMGFSSFTTWMEAQKRMASAVPPVGVEVRTISKDNARVVLRFSGDIGTLQRVLAEKGIALTPGPVNVAGAAAGLYSLQLTN